MTITVLQLMLAPAIGGAETLANGLTSGLAEHGFDVDNAYLDPDGASGAPTARLARLFRLVCASRADVILAHSALPNAYARVVAGRTPVVAVLHSASRDFDNPVLRRAERLLGRRTALVVAVASQQAEEYRGRFGDRVPLVVIPNGVAADLPVRATAALGDRPVRIVTLARINQQKDPATWRGAATLVVAEQNDVVFAWSGPESADAAVQSLVADSGVAAIAWAGPTADAGGVLAGADIYFHPARAEAHPLAPLEAAAVGLPIVCSDAVAATLPDGLPAAVFVSGDARSAADALLRVAEGLDAMTRHAFEWRPRVRADFGLERVCADYAAALHDVLGSVRVATPTG